MKKNLTWLSIAVLICSTAAVAGALSNKKRQKEIEESNVSDFKAMNEACGSKMTLVIDMAKYDEAGWQGYGPSCSLGFDGVKHVCAKSEDFKAAVAKEFKTFKCSLISGTKGSVKVSGSTIQYLAVANGDVANDTTVEEAVTKAVDK